MRGADCLDLRIRVRTRGSEVPATLLAVKVPDSDEDTLASDCRCVSGHRIGSNPLRVPSLAAMVGGNMHAQPVLGCR